MGGYSECCSYCDKWFTKANALQDHVKGKHPKQYIEWMLKKGWMTKSDAERHPLRQ